MSFLLRDEVFLTTKLEETFNEIFNDEKFHKEVAILHYRRENATREFLLGVYDKLVTTSKALVFSWVKHNSIYKEFRKMLEDAFLWEEEFNQGSNVRFNEEAKVNVGFKHSPDFLITDKDLLLESDELIVSKVYGKFLSLKSTKDQTTTAKFFHSSRFIMTSTGAPSMSVVHNHKFKPATMNFGGFKEGDIIWEIKTLSQKKVVAIAVSEDNKNDPDLLMIKSPQNPDEATELRIASDFRRKHEQIQALDSSNHSIKIGHRVLLSNIARNLDDVMKSSGWGVIDDHAAYSFWSALLGRWIAEIVEFQGPVAVIKFLPTPFCKALQMDKFYFRAPISHLKRIPDEPVKDLMNSFMGRAVEKDSYANEWETRMLSNLRSKVEGTTFVSENRESSRRMTMNPLSHSNHGGIPPLTKWELEKLAKEKEEQEIKKRNDELDKSQGPYNLDAYKDKIIEIVDFGDLTGKRGICYLVDNEFGRVHVRFRGNTRRDEDCLYFRKSNGDIDHVKIYSDIVVSDEGEEG